MSNIPDELRYTAEHEWVRVDEDDTILVGITDYAQDALGDVVYVELPKEGQNIGKDEPAGVVESTKSVSDIFSPISGKVVEINDGLESNPEFVNEDPYEEGWMFRIKPANTAEFDELMSAEQYEEFIGDLED